MLIHLQVAELNETGRRTLKWIYGQDGIADPDEVALAGSGISAILSCLDLASATPDAAAAALCLLSRCVGELSEAAGSLAYPCDAGGKATHLPDDNASA